MFIITEPTPYSFKLPGLSPHQLIGVSISASTIVGEGPVSFIISERTSQAGKNFTKVYRNPLAL